VAGHPGAGGITLRRKGMYDEDSLPHRGHPAARGWLDMSCLDIGRRVLPDGRIHQPRRAVGTHGLSRAVHGVGHMALWKSGPVPASRVGECACKQACIAQEEAIYPGPCRPDQSHMEAQ
jgi:hypothetical protein